MPQSERSCWAEFRPIDIIEARNAQSPFVFCSPHSGRRYDPQFLKACRVSLDQLRRLEDSYVDLLFMDVPAYGAQFLRALFPRAFVDVNRDRDDLDPSVVRGVPAGSKAVLSPQAAAGYGVIPRNTHDGARIYREKISRLEAAARLRECYDPYHQALQGLIQKIYAKFGFVILIDCHSMPSMSRHPAGYEAGNSSSHRGQLEPDIVLGDRYGTSCDPALTKICEDILGELGFQVRRNFPYAGGYVTRRYGQPWAGVHVIQIEINRSLYLDEARIIRHDGYDHMQGRLMRFAQALIDNKALLSLGVELLTRPAAE